VRVKGLAVPQFFGTTRPNYSSSRAIYRFLAVRRRAPRWSGLVREGAVESQSRRTRMLSCSSKLPPAMIFSEAGISPIPGSGTRLFSMLLSLTRFASLHSSHFRKCSYQKTSPVPNTHPSALRTATAQSSHPVGNSCPGPRRTPIGVIERLALELCRRVDDLSCQRVYDVSSPEDSESDQNRLSHQTE
jgi:hypothetical protein